MKTLTDAALVHVAEFLRCLGETNRLRILRSLQTGERPVGAIMAELGLSQPNVSKHLSVLTAARMVTCRRAGNFSYYRLADPNVTAICSKVCRSIAQRMRGQRSALRDIEAGILPGRGGRR